MSRSSRHAWATHAAFVLAVSALGGCADERDDVRPAGGGNGFVGVIGSGSGSGGGGGNGGAGGDGGAGDPLLSMTGIFASLISSNLGDDSFTAQIIGTSVGVDTMTHEGIEPGDCEQSVSITTAQAPIDEGIYSIVSGSPAFNEAFIQVVEVCDAETRVWVAETGTVLIALDATTFSVSGNGLPMSPDLNADNAATGTFSADIVATGLPLVP